MLKFVYLMLLLFLVGCNQETTDKEIEDVLNSFELLQEKRSVIQDKATILTDEQILSLMKMLLEKRIPKTVAFINENNLKWMMPYLYMAEGLEEFNTLTYKDNYILAYEGQIEDYQFRNEMDLMNLKLSEIKELVKLKIYITESPKGFNTLCNDILLFQLKQPYQYKYKVYECLLPKCINFTERDRIFFIGNFSLIHPKREPLLIKDFSKELESIISIIEGPYDESMFYNKFSNIIWAKQNKIEIPDHVIEKVIDLIHDEDYMQSLIEHLNDEYNVDNSGRKEFQNWIKAL